MEYRYKVFSKREREELIKSFFSEEKMTSHFLLSVSERNMFKNFRKSYNSLGYALQFLFLKNRGIYILNSYDLIPEKIIIYVSSQIDGNYNELNTYFTNKNTKFRHFQEISQILNYKRFELTTSFKEFLFNVTFHSLYPIDMFHKIINKFMADKIIIPSFSKIEEIISKSLNDSNKFIYEKISSKIENKQQLYSILNNEEIGISTFSRIKNFNINVSSSGIKDLLKIIKEIDAYGEITDLSFLSSDKIKYFRMELRRSDRFRIERFHDENKKHSYLAMFLYFKRKEFVDMAIEDVSDYAHILLKRSKLKIQKYNIKRQEKYKRHFEELKSIIKTIFEIDDFESFKEYKISLIDLKFELENQEDELEEIDFLIKSHQNITYINDFLGTIEFDSNTKPDLATYIKNFKHQKNKKKIKDDISFFDNKWKKTLKNLIIAKK